MNIANRVMDNFVHFWWSFRLSVHNSTDIELTEYMKFRLTFHIKLVSFKNIDIRPIYEPKSIKFSAYAQIWPFLVFGSLLSHLCPIWMKIHTRVPGTTRYK